jgi:hypothetical protein
MENSMSGMIKVPSAESQRNIGRYQDMALTRPVAVTRNGRERTVMIRPKSKSGTDHVYCPRPRHFVPRLEHRGAKS